MAVCPVQGRKEKESQQRRESMKSEEEHKENRAKWKKNANQREEKAYESRINKRTNVDY